MRTNRGSTECSTVRLKVKNSPKKLDLCKNQAQFVPPENELRTWLPESCMVEECRYTLKLMDRVHSRRQ